MVSDYIVAHDNFGAPSDIPDQTGRTVIVTGANSGIGRAAAARSLAAKGARVVLAVRDIEQGPGGGRATCPARPRSAQLDLASLDSVREFAAGVGRRRSTC